MTDVSREDAVMSLPDVPVRLFLESQDHQQELIRELQLVEIGGRADPTVRQASQRLAQLITEVLTSYEQVRSSTREQAEAALGRGDAVVTLRVPVSPGMAQALRRWVELLEQADQLCRHGELLLVSARPEVRRLRRWYAEQLGGLLEGRSSAEPFSTA